MRTSPSTRTTARRTAARIGILAALAASTAVAQRAPRPASPPEPPDRPASPAPPVPPEWSRARPIFAGAPATRGALLGVTLTDVTSPDDTIGVLLDTVEEGQAAAKAGIRSGARLVSFDGVNLQLDPADMGDSAAEALPAARLRRALARKSPGDTVIAEVAYGRRRETRTIILGSMPMPRALSALTTGRRMLGVGFADRGSMRDTAGLLITSLTTGGAAEKAGLLEGDRLVSIDGVDLRVPAADAGSGDAVQARVARLRRTLDALTDSSAAVRLEVLSEGRRRTMQVTPTWSRGFTIDMGRLRDMADDLRTDIRANFREEREDDDLAEARIEARRGLAEARREAAEGQREAARSMAEAQREAARARAAGQREAARERARVRIELERDRDRRRDERDERDDDASDRRDDDERPVERACSQNDESDRGMRGSMRGRTNGATLGIGGLLLATIDEDFAQSIGSGSERGLLVVRRLCGGWDPLRAGDVILSVDGRAVRDGKAIDITIERRKDLRIEVLRSRNRLTLVVPAVR